MVLAVNSMDYLPAEMFCLQVPKNSKENRKLKYGHVEDDNVDLAYLNFPVMRASFIFTLISLTAFSAALIFAMHTDYRPFTEDELVDNTMIIKYGGTPFRCTTFLRFPTDGLLSILNLFEINVWGNVLFRFSTSLTIAVRIFHSIIFRNSIMTEHLKHVKNPIFRWFADLIPLITGLETISLALFSIMTMHSDFRDANQFCKSVFAISASINLFIASSFHFLIFLSDPDSQNGILVVIRTACSVIFGYYAPQYFQFHAGWTKASLCHSYVPREYAIMEYALIISYMTFQLLALVELAGLQFICYPRTASGETEPLNPENFEKGAKYEHCRAFEYNQNRLRESYMSFCENNNGNSVNF